MVFAGRVSCGDRRSGEVVGERETLMSLSHWVIEIRSRYARNSAPRDREKGVIDGCHYRLTRSRHHRVGQLILGPGSLCYTCVIGLTRAQVIHRRPRLFINAPVVYIINVCKRT